MAKGTKTHSVITCCLMNTFDAAGSATVCTENGRDCGVLMQELSSLATGDLPPLWADEHLLVADKPAGLLCVPGRGADKQDCLATRLQQAFADARVVHRLDMATSGLWLMARGARQQRALSQAFAERRVEKRYVAVVAGRLDPADANGAWALIDLPIAADWPNRPRRIIDRQLGKPSQTGWRVLSHDAAADTTRLELAPLTGRSHQLRVHLQALGHPMLGDALYAPAEVAQRSPRLLLHATALVFDHPETGARMAFASAAPF
jgi:tRNA pseudouridine32 synthase/23S rRNA pseudouridine746 synthase